MKLSYFNTLAAIGALFGASGAVAATGDRLDRSRLVQTFAEECTVPPTADSRGLQGKWKTQYWFGTQRGVESRRLKNELQVYSDVPFNGYQPVIQYNGKCVITLAPSTWAKRTNGLPYVSGLLTTEKSFKQQYGYFEMRATLPVGKGTWPAFWLLPLPSIQAGMLKNTGVEEIDVVEGLGGYNQVWQTVHTKSGQHGSIIQMQPVNYMHTYGVRWTAQDIIWYIDDYETYRQPNRDFHRPAYMLVNLAAGGWSGTPTSATVIPAKLQIDRIRAYQFRP